MFLAIIAWLGSALAAPAGAGPAAGKGGKFTESIEFGPLAIPCDGANDIVLTANGWVQGRDFGSDKRNRAVHVFHIDLTYENTDGDTWRFRDRGPDKIFVLDGVEHVAVTGRSSFSGVIGRLLLNTETFEIVRVSGHVIGEGGPTAIDVAACEALS